MKTKCLTVVLLALAVVAVEGIKKSNLPEDKGAASGNEGSCCTQPTFQDTPIPTRSDTETPMAKKTRPRLLDLGASKCIPCKMMAPILEEMKETFEETLHVEFIDVWENPDAAEPYNIRIIPTQIFYDAEGKELFRHEGFFSREDLLAKWKELGFEFPESVEQQQGEKLRGST